MIAKFIGGPFDDEIKVLPDDITATQQLSYIKDYPHMAVEPEAAYVPTIESATYFLVDKWTDETGTFARFLHSESRHA